MAGKYVREASWGSMVGKYRGEVWLRSMVRKYGREIWWGSMLGKYDRDIWWPYFFFLYYFKKFQIVLCICAIIRINQEIQCLPYA